MICDGTLGAAGHTRALLEAADLRVVGFDRDASALELAKSRLGALAARVQFVHASFEEMPQHLERLGIGAVDGILLDLGVSSMQLDQAERGFSFRNAGPIDMRMDPSQGQNALELLEELAEDELADILWRYGEERASRRIARALKDAALKGLLLTTLDLANVVANSMPGALRRKSKIHPATRTFQALRIAVNRELEQLEKFLDFFPRLLAPKGRCAVISFHSLEDRLVKRCFRDLAKCSNLPPDLAKKAGERVHPICTPITRKPVVANDDEIKHNPRARSAKLRVCEKAAA